MAGSIINNDDKTKVKNQVKLTSYGQNSKILMATIARVFYAFPDPNQWKWTGLAGALAIVKGDKSVWFKLVDLDVSLLFYFLCSFLLV